MVSAVHTPYRILYLSGADLPKWFSDLCQHLSYEETTPKSIAGAPRAALQRLQADAIVAPYERSVARSFRTISEAYTLPHRPLLVFILHDDVANAPADLLLPPLPFAIQQSISRALQQREEQLVLTRQHEAFDLERTTLNQNLEQQQRLAAELNLLKNAMVRNISHELKTPLLHVKSAVSLLAEEKEGSKLADYATEAVARLETVITNITQLADGLDINLSPILVQDAVDQALRSLRRSWEHKNKLDRIHIDVDNTLPPVMGDKQGLGIVLHQLLDNALKFSQDLVAISARRHGKHVHVSVIDRGIGIPKDKCDQIFETFYQIDSASTRRFGGAGVGLAIVRLILDRHAAPISVASEEGHGSTFTFKLPIANVRIHH
jgi:signal transduction histidine kinase